MTDEARLEHEINKWLKNNKSKTIKFISHSESQSHCCEEGDNIILSLRQSTTSDIMKLKTREELDEMNMNDLRDYVTSISQRLRVLSGHKPDVIKTARCDCGQFINQNHTRCSRCQELFELKNRQEQGR